MTLYHPLPAICFLYSFHWNHHNFPKQILIYIYTWIAYWIFWPQKKSKMPWEWCAPANHFTPPSFGASRNTSYRCLVPRRPWSFSRRPCIGLTFFVAELNKKPLLWGFFLVDFLLFPRKTMKQLSSWRSSWVQNRFLVKKHLNFPRKQVWQWVSHQKTWICLR